jgi:hypothetical protein
MNRLDDRRSSAVLTAVAATAGASCMTVLRAWLRRRGVIDVAVPEAAARWSGERLGLPRHTPRLHVLWRQALHLGYGAGLGAAFGLVRPARGGWLARGVALGVAAWFAGSWVTLPALRIARAPWRARASDNAVDLGAHLVFGLTTVLVADDLGRSRAAQGGATPTYRRRTG